MSRAAAIRTTESNARASTGQAKSIRSGSVGRTMGWILVASSADLAGVWGLVLQPPCQNSPMDADRATSFESGPFVGSVRAPRTVRWTVPGRPGGRPDQSTRLRTTRNPRFQLVVPGEPSPRRATRQRLSVWGNAPPRCIRKLPNVAPVGSSVVSSG